MTDIPFQYPLKMSENQEFPDVFRGYRKEALISSIVFLILEYTTAIVLYTQIIYHK